MALVLHQELFNRGALSVLIILSAFALFARRHFLVTQLPPGGFVPGASALRIPQPYHERGRPPLLSATCGRTACLRFPRGRLLGIELLVGAADQDHCDDKRQDVGDRHRIQYTVQPEEKGEQQGKTNTEDNLADHQEQGRHGRLTQRLKENKAGLVDAGEDDHAQVNAERPDGKVGIIDAFVFGAENGDQRLREKSHDYQRNSADEGFGDQ